MSSITAQLELLTNLLHHSADAKIAAADAACLQIQRKLWTLQAQQPEPAFTTQLLRVAAASVSHCAEAQAWWHERLLDVRLILRDDAGKLGVPCRAQECAESAWKGASMASESLRR